MLASALPPAAAIATAPLLAQSLGVVGRGEVASATAPLLLAVAAATLGLPAATTNAVARFPNTLTFVLRRASLIIVLVGVIATLLVYLLSGFLSGGAQTIQSNILLASIAITPGLLISLLIAAAMGLHKWHLVAASRSFESGGRLIAIIVLAMMGNLTVTTATVVIAFSPLLGVIPLVRLAKYAPRAAREDDPQVRTRSLTGFGLRVWIGSLSGVVLSRIDQVLMVPLSGPLQLGLYSVAANISEVPLIVNNAVRDVVFSSQSAQAQDERAALASRLSTIATFLFALLIGVTLPLWLGPVFGQGFDAALPATLVLLVAITLGNPGSVAGATLSARGRPGLRSISLLVAATINVTLLILLVPLCGALGGAVAALVGNLISSNMNIIFLWKYFGVRPSNFYAFRISDFMLLGGVVRSRLRRKK